jgi:hypothetical protein
VYSKSNYATKAITNYWITTKKTNKLIMGILSQAKDYSSFMMETHSSIRLKTKLIPSPVGVAIVEERRDLDAAFSPGEFDVVCGKGG